MCPPPHQTYRYLLYPLQQMLGEREGSRQKLLYFCNLILEMTFYQFFYILFIRIESLGRSKEENLKGYDTGRQGSLEAHLEAA